MTSDNIIADCLSRFGFGSNTSQVLRALVQSPGARAGWLANSLKIKRPSVYLALDELKRRGLVDELDRDGIKRYSVVTIQELKSILQNSLREETDSKLKSLDLVTGMLSSLASNTLKISHQDIQVRLFKQEDSILNIAKQTLEEGAFCALWNPKNMTPRSREITKDFLRSCRDKKFSMRELFPPGKDSTWYAKQIVAPNHEVRFLPPDFPCDIDLMITEISVSFISLANTQTPFALRIENRGMISLLQLLFEQLWENCRKV